MVKIEDKGVAKNIARLEKLLENAGNPKLVWEEMQIVSKKAFDAQDEIMLALQEREETEQDISAIQELFETREYVWDLMYQIAVIETALRDKTLRGGHVKGTEGCGCGHHDDDGCGCTHDDEDICGCGCGHAEKPKKATPKPTRKKAKK